MGHTASANGGVLSAIGAGSSSVKLSDIFVENSSGVNGGGFEIKASNLDCERCTMSGMKASHH